MPKYHQFNYFKRLDEDVNLSDIMSIEQDIDNLLADSSENQYDQDIKEDIKNLQKCLKKKSIEIFNSEAGSKAKGLKPTDILIDTKRQLMYIKINCPDDVLTSIGFENNK